MTENAPAPDDAECERLIGELSDLAIRIVRSGGPGALAACTAAIAEGTAAALPVSLISEFVQALLGAVASGARIAGHKIDMVVVAPEASKPSGAVH